MLSFDQIICAIRTIHKAPEGFIALHSPVFGDKEREYVLSTIESTFVSSVGEYVNMFEKMLCQITGAEHAVACVNGTSALFLALLLAGVGPGDLVITQSFSFVATANAISHTGAEPVFLDIDPDNLGISTKAVRDFLSCQCEHTRDGCRHRATGRRVKACVPVHTFGFPCDILTLCEFCQQWGIAVIEDAAEALGSVHCGRHCGSFGQLGVLSFNGNKICTTGGGGAILTNDAGLAKRAKHLCTTAKRPHPWNFYHDEIAWNLRLPNLNAALGCAQLERLWDFVAYKRRLANAYQELFMDTHWIWMSEQQDAQANYWLCAVLLQDRDERDSFLKASNDMGVMTRPAWDPLHTLPMYQYCLRSDLTVTVEMGNRLVNLPSGVSKDITCAHGLENISTALAQRLTKND